MRTITLTPVEQAYVHEIAQQAQAAQAEIQRVSNAKLAVVLDAHGCRDVKDAAVHFDGKAWTLQVPDDEPPVNDG